MNNLADIKSAGVLHFALELRLLSSRSFPPIGGVDGVRARKAAGRNRAGDVFERVVCFHQMRASEYISRDRTAAFGVANTTN